MKIFRQWKQNKIEQKSSFSKQFFVTSVFSSDNSYPRMMQKTEYFFCKYTVFISKRKYLYKYFSYSANVLYIFEQEKSPHKYVV